MVHCGRPSGGEAAADRQPKKGKGGKAAGPKPKKGKSGKAADAGSMLSQSYQCVCACMRACMLHEMTQYVMWVRLQCRIPAPSCLGGLLNYWKKQQVEIKAQQDAGVDSEDDAFM
jgi:hypothetical protein